MTRLQQTIATPIDRARTLVEQALQAEGFAVLTEIDVQAIFRARLGAEHEGHRILGVCNPQFAKLALDLDRDVATLLPCTVTLREVVGGTEVTVLDPHAVFTLAAPETHAALAPLADDVATRLSRALEALTTLIA